MPSAKPVIDVAAAAFTDANGQVLIAERPPGKPLAGYWEFPGGKLESGETAEQALRRECLEELGVTITASRPLIRFAHDYPERRVVLHVHRVTQWRGSPQPLEGQALLWAFPDQLFLHRLLPANRPIVNALRLPDTYAVTPADAWRQSERFLAQLEHQLASGLRLLQFRCRSDGIDDPSLAAFAEEVRDLTQRFHARLMVNGDAALAAGINADGLHLPARMLADSFGEFGADRGSDRWLAASCHDGDELQRAVELGCDFVVLGPVAETASHPGASLLGWQGFQTLVDTLPVPVFAIGGQSAAAVDVARQHGAQGVAGIRAFFPASD